MDLLIQALGGSMAAAVQEQAVAGSSALSGQTEPPVEAYLQAQPLPLVMPPLAAWITSADGQRPSVQQRD